MWLQGFGGYYQSRAQPKGAAHGRLQSTSDRLFRCIAPSGPIPLVSDTADLASAVSNNSSHPETTSWTHDLSTFRTLAPLRHPGDASQRRGKLLVRG